MTSPSLRQVADLRPDGSVRDLVDVEDMQPEVEALYQAICEATATL